MTFKVILNSGILLEEKIEYAVIKNEDGETAILRNHIPIILTVTNGYIRLVNKNLTGFVVVYQGLVEFKNDELTVLAIEAQIGNTLESAQKAFDDTRKDRLEQSRKEVVDFSAKEKELKENIKKGQAGQL